MSEATAFVPGHVTAFFAVEDHEDPLRAGSRGGGLALSEGVTVTVREGDGVVLNGESVAVGAVAGVLAALDVSARVECETALPIGAGFGVSGAMALGTALAADAAFGCARTDNELVRLAHVADVEAGTGLGDVVAQARGGLPLRLDPGAPGYGTLDGIPAAGRVEYLSFGELSTRDVLADDTAALSTAGDRALEAVLETPTTPVFMDRARRFAAETGLVTERLAAVLADVADAGGRASMAMLGETAFAFGDGLSAAGYDPVVCEVHAGGATLV